MNTHPHLIIISLFVVMVACTSHPVEEAPNRSEQVETVARDFFATFAERSDWEKFCAFYREDLQFEDVMLQLKLDGLWQLKRFYQWDEEKDNFRKLSPDQEHISIETLVVNDSVAVMHGWVNPFYYYDELVESEWGMDVTFWLYFDENLKIKRQIDWIEYAPEVLESVIKRCRENGVEATPDWLDLSR